MTMPFPTTPILDDFNRGNGVLGDNWIVTIPTLEIISYKCASLGGEGQYAYNQIFQNDLEVYCDVFGIGFEENIEVGIGSTTGLYTWFGYAFVLYHQSIGDWYLDLHYEKVEDGNYIEYTGLFYLEPAPDSIQSIGLRWSLDGHISGFYKYNNAWINIFNLTNTHYICDSLWLYINSSSGNGRADNFGGGTANKNYGKLLMKMYTHA